MKCRSNVLVVVAGVVTTLVDAQVNAAPVLEIVSFTASELMLRQSSEVLDTAVPPIDRKQPWWEGRIVEGWRVSLNASASAALTLNGLAEKESSNLQIGFAINAAPKQGMTFLVRGVRWESLRGDFDEDLLGFLVRDPTVPANRWRRADGTLFFDRQPTRSKFKVSSELPDVLRNVRASIDVDVASRIRAFDIRLEATPQWQPVANLPGWSYWVEIGPPSGSSSTSRAWSSEERLKPPLLKVRLRAPRSDEPGMSFAPLIDAGLCVADGALIDFGDTKSEKTEDTVVTREIVVSLADREASTHVFRLNLADSVEHVKIPLFYDTIPLLGDSALTTRTPAIPRSSSQMVTLPSLRSVGIDNFIFQPKSSKIVATLQSSPGGMSLWRRISIESEVRLGANFTSLPQRPRLEITTLTDEHGNDLTPYCSTTHAWEASHSNTVRFDGWFPPWGGAISVLPLNLHIAARSPMPRKLARLAGSIELTTFGDEVVVPLDAAKLAEFQPIEAAPGLRVRCTPDKNTLRVEYVRPFTMPPTEDNMKRTASSAGPPFVVAVESQAPGDEVTRLRPTENATENDVRGQVSIPNAQATSGQLRLIIIPKVTVRRMNFDYADVPIAGSWPIVP